MTRDEAIAITNEKMSAPDRSVSARWVDVFVALGVLKFDEPKTAADQLYELMGDASWRRENLFERMAECGLEIVKK